MPGTILLIRHGETAWNREKIFRGTYDVPLNENGCAQAALATRALAERRIDAAYTSALSRARETAAIMLAPHHIQAAIHEGLKDFNFGNWTGLRDTVVAEKWPSAYALWSVTPHLAQPPGGDTLVAASTRVRAALDEIVSRHNGATVALFTHRIVNKLLVLAMLGLPLDRFKFIRQDNCCINEFEFTPEGYVAVSINDVSHLRMAGTSVIRADF